MAELEVGKQCSVPTCKQLDFLPFTCRDCSAIFCLEHRSTTSHNCSGELKIDQRESERVQNVQSIECFFTGCTTRELLPVKCEFCEGMFCLRHRHQQDHLCPKNETPTDPSAVQDEGHKVSIPRKEKTGRGGTRSSSRAAKVALMKMKLHAIGDNSTPQAERIYFSVVLPTESSEKTKPMFFSKNWSIGRIIDQIAKVCNIENQNNKESARKLRLFAGVSRKILNISNTLETEMNGNPETLINGSDLVLGYV